MYPCIFVRAELKRQFTLGFEIFWKLLVSFKITMKLMEALEILLLSLLKMRNDFDHTRRSVTFYKRITSFPNYEKLKAISECIQLKSTGRSCSRNVIQRPSQPVAPLWPDSMTPSAMSFLPSTSSNIQLSSGFLASGSLLPRVPSLTQSTNLQSFPSGFQEGQMAMDIPYTDSLSFPPQFSLASSDAFEGQQVTQSVQVSAHSPHPQSSLSAPSSILHVTHSPALHDLWPEDPCNPAFSFHPMARRTDVAIPQLADNPHSEIQPVLATSLQHPSSKSSPSLQDQETADFIHRWIRSLPSDFSPSELSPKLSVKRKLGDEAAFSGSDDGLFYSNFDDGFPHRDSDDGLHHRPSVEPVTINPASAIMSMTAPLCYWSATQRLARAQQPPDELDVVKALQSISKSLSANSTLPNKQKAELLLYFCKHPVAAAAVPDDALVRERFFQDHLKHLLDTE